MNKSVSTIDSPEFLNLQPLEINPLMSSCQIKVLYVGQNRNRSVITKAVASEMAKTLRGAPIVGAFKDSKEDFTDHGERVHIDDEGIKFECATKPYGFVSPDAKVWFQFFEEKDEFGNVCVREYLMTNGYLWTEQYKECKLAIEEGRPQSMELEEESLRGHWTKDPKTNIDFFIINDAVFSKLCILGKDVEPCFEGASIEKTQSNFTKMDGSFKTTLFSMIEDLKGVIKGGKDMEENKTLPIEEEILEPSVEEPSSEFKKEEEEAEKEPVAEEEKEAPAEEEDTEEEEKETKHSLDEEFSALERENETLKAEIAAMKEQCDSLIEQVATLKEENKKLSEFKLVVENEKKDSLINSFYMLSDEDKAEVIENKTKYSLDEIEAKLSVVCVRKKVSFTLEEEKKEEEPTLLFTVDNGGESAPAFVNALRNIRNR